MEAKQEMVLLHLKNESILQNTNVETQDIQDITQVAGIMSWLFKLFEPTSTPLEAIKIMFAQY